MRVFNETRLHNTIIRKITKYKCLGSTACLIIWKHLNQAHRVAGLIEQEVSVE